MYGYTDIRIYCYTMYGYTDIRTLSARLLSLTNIYVINIYNVFLCIQLLSLSISIAWNAAEVAARMIKPGNTNTEVCIYLHV